MLITSSIMMMITTITTTAITTTTITKVRNCHNNHYIIQQPCLFIDKNNLVMTDYQTTNMVISLEPARADYVEGVEGRGVRREGEE